MSEPSKNLKYLAHLTQFVNRFPMSDIEREVMQKCIDEMKAAFDEFETLKTKKDEQAGDKGQ